MSEIVMTDGMIVEAANDYGTIRIEAGNGTWRTYSWEDRTERVRLLSRRNRWYGSLGLYHPAAAKGVHLVVGEGQQHFCSESEAMEWLKWQKTQRSSLVYRSDGFAVGWSRAQNPDSDYWAVGIEVWQIYINGHKPQSLHGATTEAIRISHARSAARGTVEPSGFAPRKPKTIDGRDYSGKALDFMAEQNISSKQIEDAIAKGDLVPSVVTTEGWKCYFLSKHMLVVIVAEDGRVVLAYR